MYLAQARQQLLHLLHYPISSRLLQAHPFASTSFISSTDHGNTFASSKFCTTSSQQPAAAEVPWSSSDSSSRGMAAAAAAEGYDNQWVEHWKQGVSPGQVRMSLAMHIPLIGVG
jgi:hypothetical protein